MSKEHHIIYIPGLNDQSLISRNLVKLLPFFWESQGFHAHVVSPRWEEGARFAPKLKLITDEIDRLVDQGHRVSLVGQSAGGSAALNAFYERRNVVNGVVNATGRLKAGVHVRPSLEWAARNSPAFKESVLLFEQQNEAKLTAKDRRKIMTMRPIWDEIVPSSTVSVKGATNKIAPILEHGIGGVFIVSFYSRVILNFLRNIENSDLPQEGKNI